MPVDRRRAWLAQPMDLDAWDVFVVEDVHGGRSRLLCGDGEWREYEPYQVLTEAPLSPTRRVTGAELVGYLGAAPVLELFTEGLPAEVVPLVERALRLRPLGRVIWTGGSCSATTSSPSLPGFRIGGVR